MCIHCRGIIEGVRNGFYPLEHSTLARVMTVREEGSDGVPVITRPQVSADDWHQEIRHMYPEAVIPHHRLPTDIPQRVNERQAGF